MLVGAVTGFITLVLTGNYFYSLFLSIISGVILSGIFAFLVLNLMTNQIATGLALTIFGIGLSAMLGKKFSGTPIDGLNPYYFIVISFLLVFFVAYFLSKTRLGLILRAVGESHDSAHALGYPVLLVRFLAILFGGFMCGLAGSYLSLAYTPLWAENMTAGRGWIAVALVVFGTWRAGRVALGAYLFGTITILQLHVQGWGLEIASQFMSMLPYLATIAVLVLISRDGAKIRLNAPQSIGKAFTPSR